MKPSSVTVVAILLLTAAEGLWAEPSTPTASQPTDPTLRDHVPQVGVFPPAGAGIECAGELIDIAPGARSGGLRLDGDFVDRNVLFRFAVLPYGEVYYHGSPAELQDIPLGTRIHGRFLLPPEGDTKIPPPSPEDKDAPRHSYALIVEDDFSHQSRRGGAWKVTGVDLAKIDELPRQKGILSVESTLVGPGGTPDVMKLDISRATRIWKTGGGLVELESLTPGQVIQVNLGWAPEWRNREFHCIDIWLDAESQKEATERQRRIHYRKMAYFWPAGWIDHVEHEPGGSGIVTVTPFGGIDGMVGESLRGMAGRDTQIFLAVADANLMTWWQDHDKAAGRVIEIRNIPDPPPGNSGLQVRVAVAGPLLEGFRPGRFVRMKANARWPNGVTPPGERRSKWNPLTVDAGSSLDGRPAKDGSEGGGK